jgi:signal transduction histidine kinase
MKFPSIKRRLMLGTGLIFSIVLVISQLEIYHSVRKVLILQIFDELTANASILTKSSEVKPSGVIHEWHEADKAGVGRSITGLFQVWDVKSGKSFTSPELNDLQLKFFHGAMNEPVRRDSELSNGTEVFAVGLMHLPFIDAYSGAEMKRLGISPQSEDYPQVLVCARDKTPFEAQLQLIRWHMVRAGVASLVAIWLSIWAITRLTLRPIDELTGNLDRRSRADTDSFHTLPDKWPAELRGLAESFNLTLERAEAARRREREFAMHAAHELRTPVAGILATLDLALKRPRTAEDLVRRIANALVLAEGMQDMVGSLMKLARVRGGLERLELTRFDPGELATDVARGQLARFRERNLKLEWDGPNDPLEIAGDAGLVRLVFVILFDNAGCHASSGTQVFVASACNLEGFSFSLTNASNDLVEADIERIFEPFQRGESATSDGAGLGLSLAREIMNLLDGTLNATLTNGEFTIRLFLPIRI